MVPLNPSSSDSRRQLTLLLLVWIPAVVIVWLLAGQPYASGYGFLRFPLLHIAAIQWERPDWEHCGLVPLGCALILYLDKERLGQITPVSSAWGLVVSAFGFAVYWIGYRVDSLYFGYAAIQILLAGMIITVLGWKFMRALFFPWLFLNFMWPLLFLDNYLAFPLRLIMSEASVQALNLIGIPTVQVGTAILSAPEDFVGYGGRAAGALFSVDVADPCSGIRSLFALMMVSALYGYFTMASTWKRVVLFLCAAPLAVMGNLVRILMLTIGTLAFGAEFAIGKGLEEPSTFHMAAGFIVFGVALAGMLGVHKLLEWSTRERTAKPISDRKSVESPKISGARPVAEDEY